MMLMTRLPRLLRLLPFALVLVGLAFAASCGDDDATPTPRPTLEITAADEQAIDKTIADTIAALQLRTRTALDGLVNDKLRARPETLDRLATCFPEGASLSVRNREFKASSSDVRITINFTVTENGATQNSRRDWRLEKQGDGSFKFSVAPDCPFGRVVPSANTGETPTAVATAVGEQPTEVPLETDTPVEAAPTDTEPPVQP